MIEINENNRNIGGEGKNNNEDKVYNFHPNYPSRILEIIYRNIVRKLERSIKELKGVESLSEIEGLRRRLIPNEEIIKSIINYIWNDFTPNQIEDELSRFLLEKNMGGILN